MACSWTLEYESDSHASQVCFDAHRSVPNCANVDSVLYIGVRPHRLGKWIFFDCDWEGPYSEPFARLPDDVRLRMRGEAAAKANNSSEVGGP